MGDGHITDPSGSRSYNPLPAPLSDRLHHQIALPDYDAADDAQYTSTKSVNVEDNRGFMPHAAGKNLHRDADSNASGGKIWSVDVDESPSTTAAARLGGASAARIHVASDLDAE